MTYRTRIDYFTSLDDVPRKLEGEPRVVLKAIMAAGGRFSCFDATRTQKMARTMTYIEGPSGWVKRKEAECQYPWVVVELTDAGKEALEM